MKKIGVIGIGNPLRKDDGVGIILLKRLQERKKEFPKNVIFVDGGTGGINILHLFAGFDIVLIIDAVDYKEKPGQSKVFTVDEIQSQKTQIRWSTHEADFLTVLELSKQLGELPQKLFIFGVQQKDFSYGNQLSNELTTVFEEVYKKLVEEIRLLSE